MCEARVTRTLAAGGWQTIRTMTCSDQEGNCKLVHPDPTIQYNLAIEAYKHVLDHEGDQFFHDERTG